MMPRPRLLIGSTLRSLRTEVLRRNGGQKALTDPPLVCVSGFGAVRGWRKVGRKSFSSVGILPRFAKLDEWFAEAALAAADVPLRLISSSERRLLLRALLTSLKPQLHELQNLVDSNQFLQQIDGWMADLFSADVDSWPEHGGPWSRDLQLILQKYQTWKKQQRGAQLWDREFAPRLFARFASNYPALPREMIVEGMVTLTPNECEGLKSVISTCDVFTAVLAVPGISVQQLSWPQLLEFTEDSVLEKTLRFWQEQDAEIEVIVPENAIHADKMTNLAQLAAGRGKIFATPAHTLRHELRRIATSIRAHSHNSVQAPEAVVLLNNPARYQDVLKSTFQEYGLPVRRLPGQPLLASPLVQKFMQLLNLPSSQWGVRAVMDIFAGGALVVKNEDHLLDMRCIEQVTVLLRHYMLDDLQNIVLQWEKADFKSSFAPSDVKKDIDALQNLQQQLATIAGAPSRAQWMGLVKQLWDDVTQHWTDAPDSENAKTALSQINNVRATLELLERGSGALENSFPGDASVWLSQLNLILSETKSAWEVGITSGVDVFSPGQLLLDVPDVVYWPGMLEADFPPLSRNSLQARHQKTISQLCPHLPTPSQQSVYQMALALVEAETLHFSWPQFCDDRTSLPTVLLEEMMDAQARQQKSAPLEEKERPDVYYSHPHWQCAVARATRLNAGVPSSIQNSLLLSLYQLYTARNSIRLNTFDGSLDESGSALVASILAARGKTLSHSASSLNAYAECGLKYFFGRLLSLEERPGISLLLKQKEVGTLIHSILEKFYTRFHHPLNEAHKAAAWEVFVELAGEETAQLPLTSVLRKAELRRLIGAGAAELQGALGRYLSAEVALRENEWKDSVFTRPMQPFGLSSLHLPQELERAYEARFNLRLDGIALEGKFDRLDAATDESMVLAVDYKTGKTLPTSKTAPDGLNFQMPLYLWALDQIFSKQGLAVGGSFYSLVDFEYKAGISRAGVLQKIKGKRATNQDARAMGEEEWNSFMAEFSRQTKSIHRLITRGQFPISVRGVDKAGCKFCDYKNICFRNEVMQAERRPVLRDEEMIYTEGLPPEKKNGTEEVNTDETD